MNAAEPPDTVRLADSPWEPDRRARRGLDAGEALDSVAADYSLDPDDVVAARFFESKLDA